MLDLLNHFRSLGFGAMFGGGVLSLLHLLFPGILPEATEIETVAAIGALIGGSAHQLIQEWLIDSFLGPIGKFVAFYTKLMQLRMLRETIPPELYIEVLNAVVVEYFIGIEKPKSNLLLKKDKNNRLTKR